MKEAYCSYEIAKLLKEKGFDEPCFAYYEDDGTFRQSWSNYAIQNKTNPCFFGNAAPTIQMACAWLREVHNLFILVGWNPTHKEYFTRIINMTDGCPKRNIYEYTNYEDAVESAIKYCLENLI